jgi:hypothetical protein
MKGIKGHNPLSTFILPAILFLAVLIRVVGIASRPIWYDEAFSLIFASRGPAAMLVGTFGNGATAAPEEHTIFYYSALWLWMLVFGNSLVAARTLSILFGTATVAISYLLEKTMFNIKVAFCAAVIVAIAPFQVHYSQEIRMYSLMAFFTTCTTYAFMEATSTGNWKWWVFFSFSAAGAQYSHALAVFYLVPLAMIPIIQRRWRIAASCMIAAGFALMIYLPSLITLPAQISKIQSAYWIDTPELYRLITSLLSFTVNLPLPGITLVAGLSVTFTITAIGVLQTIKAGKKRDNSSSKGLWLLYLSFAPPLLLFLFSQWKPVYVERGLLPSGVIFCLWLAWVILGTPMPNFVRFSMIGLLACGMAMGDYLHLTYDGFPYAPYRALDDYLSTNVAKGDVIIHSNKLSALPAIFFNPQLPQIFVNDPSGSGTDSLSPVTQSVLGVSSIPTIDRATESADHIWFIIFQKSIDEYISSGQVSHPHLDWLNAHYQLAEIQQWGDLLLFKYSK